MNETAPSQKRLTVRASPSLALIKYWGKADSDKNVPATSSLAVSLKKLYTETTVCLTREADIVEVDGQLQPPDRYAPFFQAVRKELDASFTFEARSRSNFPASAGLASSSSGFAALAYGCVKLLDNSVENKRISALARIGSASAARAIFGGFTSLAKGAEYARQNMDASHWPELRVIIAIVKGTPKKVSSRKAMEAARETSPFYTDWVFESEVIFQDAAKACYCRDLEKLGPLMRKSYLAMFSTMFTSNPPLLYWEPDSLALIKECETMREKGLNVWETMDAGPQVKMVCLEDEMDTILERLQSRFPMIEFLSTAVGEGASIV